MSTLMPISIESVKEGCPKDPNPQDNNSDGALRVSTTQEEIDLSTGSVVPDFSCTGFVSKPR